MIDFTVVCFVAKGHRVAFDRDAPFTFDIHRIEELIFEFALCDCTASLNQAVCERRLAMVDMSNDAKVANVLHVWCVAGNRSQVSLSLAFYRRIVVCASGNVRFVRPTGRDSKSATPKSKVNTMN